MPDKIKMKSVCFKCRINKWIVDYRGGCAENVSSKSICLSCEQSERMDRLERSLRAKDCKIIALERLINNLSKKEDSLGPGIATDKCENTESGGTDGDVSTVYKDSVRVNAECHEQPQEMEIGVDELRRVVMENRDNIVESGRDIVEIRQEIASIKERNEFLKVKGKKVPTKSAANRGNGIVLTNRYAVLSEEDTSLIGDSMIREQTDNFANKNKQRRIVKSFPGCKAVKVTEEIRKLKPKNRNSCIIAHAGSNDLFSRSSRDGNSEPIVKDLKAMVNAVAEKTNKGIIVGILPRRYTSYCTLSKALGINERIRKHCDTLKVEFLDLWNVFMTKWHLFKKDGIHLNDAGHRKLGEILNRECEKLANLDSCSSEESSSQVQEVLEGQAPPLVLDDSSTESLEGSFIGFPKEN